MCYRRYTIGEVGVDVDRRILTAAAAEAIRAPVSRYLPETFTADSRSITVMMTLVSCSPRPAASAACW